MQEIRRGRAISSPILWDVPYDMKSRVIYFVQRKDDPTMGKIGSTTDPLKRFSILQSSSPELLEMVGLVIGSYAHERDIQLYLRDHVIRGEWFRFNEEIHKYIDKLPSLSDFISGNRIPLMQHPAPEYFLRLYQAGYSMEEIASLFGRTRQNVHDRIKALTDQRWPKDHIGPVQPIAEAYGQLVKDHPALSLAEDH